MSRVLHMNGVKGASSEGLYFNQFSGKPTSQYEFPGDPREHRGDRFKLEVVVELTKVTSDTVKDGEREIIGFKVLEAKPVVLVARTDGHDPNQMTTDDVTDAEVVDDLDSDLADAEASTAEAIEAGSADDPMSIFNDGTRGD